MMAHRRAAAFAARLSRSLGSSPLRSSEAPASSPLPLPSSSLDIPRSLATAGAVHPSRHPATPAASASCTRLPAPSRLAHSRPLTQTAGLDGGAATRDHSRHGGHKPGHAPGPVPEARDADTASGPEDSIHSPSVDSHEVAKFRAEAASWWDTSGPHALLHRMGPARVSFIRSGVCRHFSRSEQESRPLAGLRVLDVGCGGGLLTEPLSRLGASVTGIDVVPSNIRVARLHAEEAAGLGDINYLCKSAEDLQREGHKFDVVTCLEVVEHVADPVAFIGTLSGLCNEASGVLFLSTLNRTPVSLAAAVIGAEYILRWVPPGTHDWAKFMTPGEMAAILRLKGPLVMQDLAGITLNPITLQWSLSTDTSINYITLATRPDRSYAASAP